MKMKLFVLKVITNERVQVGFLLLAILATMIFMSIMFIQTALPYDAELHSHTELAEKNAKIRIEYYENQKNSLNQ